MARLTVEDCVVVVPNRFELILLAAQRARVLGAGVRATVAVDRDKAHVLALREIAGRTIEAAALRDSLVKAHQRAEEPDAWPGDQALRRPVIVQVAAGHPAGA